MNIHTIALPTRPQIDTLIAVAILKRYGNKKYESIEKAKVSIEHTSSAQSQLLESGVLPLDQGGTALDHHSRKDICLTELVIQHLDIQQNKELQKLIEFARRDDLEGKGIISQDSLDRAFGLPGLLANLNKTYSENPEYIFDLILPILNAHIDEEMRRTYEMPNEIREKKERGELEVFDVMQRGQKLTCIIIQSDTVSMPGFLRSTIGGLYDVVTQISSTGHIAILTRPKKQVKLGALALLIRLEEAVAQNKEFDTTPQKLEQPGTIPEIPEWYYDTATNSLLNGTASNKNVPASQIPNTKMREILTLGLSEKMLRNN